MRIPDAQSEGHEVVVGVGDCRLGTFPVRSLATYALGSCMAVTAWDWKYRTGGLLHVMLPDSGANRAVPASALNPWVYVDSAIPEFLRRLEAHGVVRNRLRCTIAGGSNMMADSTSLQIGKRNYLAVRKVCLKYGLFIEKEDVGGTESRSMRLDLSTGQVDLRTGTEKFRVLSAPYA